MADLKITFIFEICIKIPKNKHNKNYKKKLSKFYHPSACNDDN